MFDRFILTELSNSMIINTAKTFDAKGWIQQNDDYCYLKIDDRFIHSIYPLLAEYGDIEIPDYFNPPDHVGAHISVIYPEERVRPSPENMGQIHTFHVCKLIKAQYGLTEYYALSVESASLNGLRRTHQLSPKPTFKGQKIMFHITVGVKILDVLF
ncbi:MAG: hypothetical protein Q8R24_10355 [Legionellaceae bacterium]|nr:hypothetical protein [Legionellaceae bacterium]